MNDAQKVVKALGLPDLRYTKIVVTIEINEPTLIQADFLRLDDDGSGELKRHNGTDEYKIPYKDFPDYKEGGEPLRGNH